MITSSNKLIEYSGGGGFSTAVMPPDYDPSPAPSPAPKPAPLPDPTPPPVTEKKAPTLEKTESKKVDQGKQKNTAQEPQEQKSQSAAVVNRNQNMKLAGVVVALILIAVFYNKAQS